MYSMNFKLTAMEMVIERGMTMKSTAEHLGCSQGAVSSWFKQFDVPYRDIEQAMVRLEELRAGSPQPQLNPVVGVATPPPENNNHLALIAMIVLCAVVGFSSLVIA